MAVGNGMHLSNSAGGGVSCCDLELATPAKSGACGFCRLTRHVSRTPPAEYERQMRWESIARSGNEIGLREVLLEELRFDTICAR